MTLEGLTIFVDISQFWSMSDKNDG